MTDVFWAAFGGGAAAGVFTLLAIGFAEWLRWFIDRPLVRVNVSFGFHLHPVIKDDTRYVTLEAANPHSKPITLSTFGFEYKRKEWGHLQVMPDEQGYVFPYQLDAGKSISQWSAEQNLIKALREAGRRPNDLRYVYFKSSAGTVYRNRIYKKFREVLEETFAKTADD